MRALVFDTTLGSWDDTRGFELQDVPEPVLDEKKDPTDADKVLLRVHYAGICGTDRGIWNRAAFRDQILGSITAEGNTRRILGHEFFGEVVALGSKASALAPSPLIRGVPRSSEEGVVAPLKIGDFAAPESHVVCNKCFQCLRGEKHVCTNEKILGISHDGGFAEFVKLPAHIIWKTDTSKIRPELGAMQEPFGNAVHAASKVPLQGKTIAIFGLGPIGLFLILVARGLGATTIIGVEPNPISQEMARRLGIDYIIPLSPRQKDTAAHHRDEAVIKKIEELTEGLGVDVSFEMAGFNSSFNNCLFATRRGGDMIAFGIKMGDFVLENYNRFIIRGITMHAVIGRRLPETWEMTQRLFSDTKNKIQENIWNIILAQGKDTILSLKDYTKERFEEMMAKHPKILIEI
ncbi:MAG TPA: theronine dehydrogenase [Candidatus Taylorbacteria bacterium]|nr:MAG: Threonine 3-dehydrogenase [Parcubacteria group bacterium GW2011_GWA2_47_64]KKU96905.1 MAG: Threonine 3-dehydrogenase [Parcubacteria group bacterium GW2011_GWC2_48_17]HBV01443.1 theronine dehydrogenase [Candidatus Taylorbacteria bacterium]